VLSIASAFAARAASALPLVTPSCPTPAQYFSHQSCVIDVPVIYYVLVIGDPTQTPNDLAQAYGFVVIESFTSFGLFRASLTPQQVAQLLCDPRVQFIEEPIGNLDLDRGCNTPNIPLFSAPALFALAAVFAALGALMLRR
jgi:hypothetical protein